MRRSQAGFTLIELMVALVIMGTLVGGISLAFRTGLDANARAREHSDRAQEVRVVLDALRADLQQARLTPDSERSWFIGNDNNDGEREADTLIFCTHSRRVPLRDLETEAEWESSPHNADWSMVTYSLAPAGTSEEYGLYRRELVPPGTDPLDETGEDELLSTAVTGISFRYFDGTDWQLSWDTQGDQAGTLPLAVEVTLSLAPVAATGEPRTVTTAFPLWVQPAPATEVVEEEVSE